MSDEHELDQRRLAHHEAGHIITAATLNIAVESATVAGTDGRAAHTAVNAIPRDVRYSDAALAVRISNAATVAAAGAVGEDEWWDRDGADLRAMNPDGAREVRDATAAVDDAALTKLAGHAAELAELTGQAKPSAEDRDRWIAARRADAAGIVAVSGPRVRMLAAELAAAGTLTGDQIAEILNRPLPPL